MKNLSGLDGGTAAPSPGFPGQQRPLRSDTPERISFSVGHVEYGNHHGRMDIDSLAISICIITGCNSPEMPFPCPSTMEVQAHEYH